MNLSEIIRKFYLTHVTGATPQMKPNQLKRMYLIQNGVALPASDRDLEKQLLRYLIVRENGVPMGKYTSELLKEALANLNLPVSNLVAQNWEILFLNID